MQLFDEIAEVLIAANRGGLAARLREHGASVRAVVRLVAGGITGTDRATLRRVEDHASFDLLRETVGEAAPSGDEAPAGYLWAAEETVFNKLKVGDLYWDGNGTVMEKWSRREARPADAKRGAKADVVDPKYPVRPVQKAEPVPMTSSAEARTRKPVDGAVKFRDLPSGDPFRVDDKAGTEVYRKVGAKAFGADNRVVSLGGTTLVWPLTGDDKAAWYAAYRQAAGLEPVADGVTRPTSADVAAPAGVATDVAAGGAVAMVVTDDAEADGRPASDGPGDPAVEVGGPRETAVPEAAAKSAFTLWMCYQRPTAVADAILKTLKPAEAYDVALAILLATRPQG